MAYKDLIQQIANLDWASVDPGDIVLLSRCTAIEFADSLRRALVLYPTDTRLLEMAAGELATDNMVFEDYAAKGDHWEFLDFFIKKYNITPLNTRILQVCDEYTQGVESLSDGDRAMTVFSREEELTAIFHKILAAFDWQHSDMAFYKYYLERHIMFDSGDTGHAYLTSHFPLHENVLVHFYTSRLNLYQCLFTSKKG
jgi:hypothetical protein